MKIHPGLLLLLSGVQAETQSIEFNPAFLDRHHPKNGDGWELKTLEARGTVLHLKTSGTPPVTPVRKPANILLLSGKAYGAFTLDLEAKTTVIDRKGADIIVVFGYQDPQHFYYAHISNDSDNKTHNIIMKVEGDKNIRTPIQLEKDPAPLLNGEWQQFRVVRTGDGAVQVFVDDMETPTLTARDSTWLKGKVGIGSFNDPAMFDEVKIQTP